MAAKTTETPNLMQNLLDSLTIVFVCRDREGCGYVEGAGRGNAHGHACEVCGGEVDRVQRSECVRINGSLVPIAEAPSDAASTSSVRPKP